MQRVVGQSHWDCSTTLHIDVALQCLDCDNRVYSKGNKPTYFQCLVMQCCNVWGCNAALYCSPVVLLFRQTNDTREPCCWCCSTAMTTSAATLATGATLASLILYSEFLVCITYMVGYSTWTCLYHCRSCQSSPYSCGALPDTGDTLAKGATLAFYA